jgi:PAS domain S-box-containing protein
MDRSVRILLLEDNLNDEELLRETLASASLRFEATRVDTEAAFRGALRENYDLILSDYSLPAFNGLKALAIARECRPEIPFIFVSGTIGEEVAIESLLGGAADYVLKHRYGRLVPAVQRVLREAGERTTRLRAEQELQVASAQLRSLFENLDEVFFTLDPRSNTMQQVSPACERIYGRTQAECMADADFWKRAVHPEDASIVASVEDAIRCGQTASSEYRIRRGGNSVRWVHARMKPVCGDDGAVARIDGIVSDITERRELEAKFLRTQRLENLGSIAGGIAHDLNNVLAPIVMGIELLHGRHADPRTQETLATLQQCALRGANMVKQILMFARGVDGQRVRIDPARQIESVEEMLQPTFPKSIRIEVDTAPDLWPISADPTQFEQILMNLCVNARDAMPEGGTVRIRARNKPGIAAAGAERASGPQIVIEVGDTGHGIPEENLERVFDPFFTTKAVGSGTGLGLSTVQAIVKNHGGTIGVRSPVGEGTTFRILLPALPADTRPAVSFDDDAFPHGNGELVMVVEDEAAIRNLTRTVLENFGYSVVVAADGREGLAIYASKGDTIGLVLTDTDMPTMTGQEMTRELRRMNPDVRVISMSGLGRPNPFADAVLPKPFSTTQLLRSFRNALHGHGPQSGRG